MKSHYEHEIGPHRIILGDALDALDLVADKSARLAKTSPPYNMRMEYERDTNLSLDEYIDGLRPIIEKLIGKITPAEPARLPGRWIAEIAGVARVVRL